jgi:hypothetical protein
MPPPLQETNNAASGMADKTADNRMNARRDDWYNTFSLQQRNVTHRPSYEARGTVTVATHNSILNPGCRLGPAVKSVGKR